MVLVTWWRILTQSLTPQSLEIRNLTGQLYNIQKRSPAIVQMLDTVGKGNTCFPIAASAIWMRNEQICSILLLWRLRMSQEHCWNEWWSLGVPTGLARPAANVCHSVVDLPCHIRLAESSDVPATVVESNSVWVPGLFLPWGMATPDSIQGPTRRVRHGDGCRRIVKKANRHLKLF